MGLKRAAAVVLIGLAATWSAGTAEAQSRLPVKFIMDWAFEGAQSFWTVAEQRGCFAKRGVDITIDRGFGSGDTVSKLAAGAYPIGVSDFNTVVQFDAKNPDRRLIAIFMISDGSPLSVVTLKENNIAKPQDLVGKKIADPVGEASRIMFPAFAKANNIDPNSVEWVTVAPDLRQPTLAHKQADAAAGHMFTVYNGLVQLGVKKEDIVVMRYADWGVNFYGNAIVTTKAWASEHPDAAKAFAACAAEGIKASRADAKAAVDTLKKYNPLLREDIELASLEFSNTIAIGTPNALKNGLSAVTKERLEQTVTQATAALELPAPPLDELWTDKYLPPRSELMLSK
ncbi:MAG: ABC transporter substrate-binding protein [Alphaproteobacteria bacterium]|nr:ABC transporter substrate-binding protein [Alphaproteobacteria bacterium]